jgi:predicted permease
MGLWQDLRGAIRLLVKDKWFTAVAAAALALGIGVNNTVFTFVNAVLIRGLPFDEPDRIMALGTRERARDQPMGTSYLDFKDWSAAARSFSGLAAFTGNVFNVSDEGRSPERYRGPYISFNAFKLIRQQPLMGRDFLPEDDRPGAPGVVILGHGIWKNRYGADPAVLGRTIRINDVPSTVIGVMPDGFKFPFDAELWQPLSLVSGLAEQKRNSRTLEVFGRLAPGVTRPEAAAELAAIGARLTRDYPDTNKDVVPTVETFNERFNGGPIKLIFLSLMGAVAFVLLIACANVANLLLARSAYRSREISVRVSLGATRWRIVRQLLVESVLLALVSGVLGFAISVLGIRWFDAVTQDVGKPYWIQFRIDGTVFGFLAAVCLGTGIIFGLAPALHVSKADVNEVLKEGGRSGASGVRARRWTAALIVSEIALTLVLLAGAGFMMRSFLALYRLDLGIETSHLLVTRLALPDRKYPTVAARLAFYQALENRLRANGRIRSAAIASDLPLQGGPATLLTIQSKPLAAGQQAPMVTRLTVDPRYFETLGIQLARGRGFVDTDGLAGHESAIVNQQFVQMHFPQEDPIGRRITLTPDPAGDAPPVAGAPTTMAATIVGIAPNVRQRNFQEREPDPIVYLPFRSDPGGFMYLLARSDGDPAGLAPLLRQEVGAIDRDLPLFRIETMEQSLAQQRWGFRVFGTMFAMFAGIALVLSAVGLYAVTAYSVAQRTQEIGVRMALGARPEQVRWLVLRRGLVQTAIGVAIGLAGAMGVGRLLQSILVQTSARDAVTLGSVIVLLVVVSIAACLAPARRATRLDPLAALRHE